MDKIELLSFQFGAGASDWHVTAGMLPRIRVDVDILQTNFAEIDHKQVRSLISELLKDLLAKASDLLAHLPIRLAQPVRVVENACRGWLQVFMVSRRHRLSHFPGLIQLFDVTGRDQKTNSQE
ncbi:MAG: hypothetical protein VXY78_04950 [Pseudomonadota bacterium]|nr:hypothetical protein [Pseudomonadota bacterium]